MRKYIYTFIFCSITSFAYAQTAEDMKYEIETGIRSFFSTISDLNDPDNAVTFERIVARYQKADDFTFNGTMTSMSKFLSDYQKNVLKNDNISHIIEKKRNVDIKLVKKGTDLYSYTGVLHRIFLDDEENVKVKDVDVNIEVFYDKSKQDSRVLIRSINFDPKLSKVNVAIKDEHTFKTNSEKTYVNSDASLATANILSTKNTLRYFPGIDNTTSRYDYVRVPFTVINHQGVRKAVVLNDSTVSCEFYNNYSQQTRTYSVTLAQSGSNKQIVWTIVQSGRSIPESPWEKFVRVLTDYDNDEEKHDINVFYSPKYDLGLSYMYTPEDSRFGFGLTLATTFNSYKELFGTQQANAFTFTSLGDHFLNGYKVEHEYLHPYNESYSELMDPYGEAEVKKLSSLMLANVGYYVNDWLRIDLGLGAACSKNIYHMNNAYGVDKFTFVKTNPSLPDVDPYYYYSVAVNDYDYKDKNKWGFAIRPSLNFRIPLVDDELYLPVGVGYTYVTNNSSISSIDFSIGISISLY